MPSREAEHWVFSPVTSINPYKKPLGAEQCSPSLKNESPPHRATVALPVHLMTNPNATVPFTKYLGSTYYVSCVMHREAPGKTMKLLQQDVVK